MIIPTDIIFKAYTTLDLTTGMPAEATDSTCRLLEASFDTCVGCSVNINTTERCGLIQSNNPDFDKSFALFYQEYPEYAI